MERSAWTDQRLDAEFSGVRQDIRDLRSELRSDMRELEIGLRSEMRDGDAALRDEIRDLRSTIHWFGGGMMLALVGVIAAILARGV